VCDIYNFDPCVLGHNSDRFHITVYADDMSLYECPGYLLDPIVLDLQTEFEVTNIGHLYWLWGIPTTFNRDAIELSQEAFIDVILERLQINDSHPMLFPIDPHTRLTKEESVPEAEEYRPSRLIIGSCLYLVTYQRSDLAHPIPSLSQLLATPSKSYVPSTKYLLWSFTGIKDLIRSFH
jgi:hypothetical protein